MSGSLGRAALATGLLILASLGVHATTAQAIVGGQPTSVSQAPWTVAVVTNSGGLCSGSILDASRVLTAEHCVRLGTVLGTGLTVIAGTSNASDPKQGERVAVAGVRVHPYNLDSNRSEDDDVAVLTLARPLNLSTPNAQPIALVPEGATPAVGTPVTAIGFGTPAAGTPSNGQLLSLGFTLENPYTADPGCSQSGTRVAIVLCASSPAGSICFGDSGGPLVAGNPPVQVGVLSGVEEDQCAVGDTASYANLAAPEIRQFINGSDQPPKAPRAAGNALSPPTVLFRQPRPKTLRCDLHPWEDSPTLTYDWVDTRNGQVVQSSPSGTYKIKRGDRGRTIACSVTATTAGGSVTTQQSTAERIRASWTTRPLTRKQKLRRALKTCKKKHGKKARATCTKRAKRKYRK
jgi:hypothetical protein